MQNFIALQGPYYFVYIVLEFPWDSKTDERLGKLRDWAYLLDFYYAPPAQKLICDFFLLLFVSRQWVVFRIEKRYAGKNYAGGSNEIIIHHAEQKGFKNPVPDFITYVR